MKKALTVVPFLMIILFLDSCGDINMFSPFGAKEGSWLELALSEGEVLAPDRSLPITIKEPRGLADPAPSRLQITFLDGNGNVIETREILDILAMASWIPLPELTNPETSATSMGESSFMQVTLELFDNQGRLLESRKVDFFVTDAVPRIDTLEVYPPGGIEVGYQCLILAQTDIALDDSYLRWTMEDMVLAEGRGAGLSNQLIWDAPEKAGVYDLSLEIFPEEPPEILNGKYSFQATERKTIELFVSEKNNTKVLEGDGYLHFFSFSGTLADTGIQSGFSSIIGEPRPALYEGQFGYRFPGDASLDLSLFSLEADGGGEGEEIDSVRDKPLTLLLRGAAFPEGAGVLFSLFADGSLLARLEKDPQEGTVLYVDGRFPKPSEIETTANPAPPAEIDKKPSKPSDSDLPEDDSADALSILDSETALAIGFPAEHLVYRVNLPVAELLSGTISFSSDRSQSTIMISWIPVSEPGAQENPDESLISFFLPVSSEGSGLPPFLPDRIIIGGEGPLFLSRLGVGSSNILGQ